MRRFGFVLVLCLSFEGVAAVPGGIYLNVPYVRQPKDGCGAACISMILQYWSRRDPKLPRIWPSVDSIQHALYHPKARGIFASSMEDYFRRQGWRVFAFHGDWNLLEEHLSKGRPLVICLREGSTLHYVVVIGMEPEKKAILVNDPAGGKFDVLRREVFEKKWSAENNWTLLALPQPNE